MAIIKWEPFGEFDNFFNNFPQVGISGMGNDMAVDLYEDGNNIIAEMSLPGVDADDVNVAVDGDYLRISGSREEKEEKKEKQFYSKEIRRGSFERVVNLPEAVNESEVEAEYENGVLKIKMPKLGEKKKEKIKIVKK